MSPLTENMERRSGRSAGALTTAVPHAGQDVAFAGRAARHLTHVAALSLMEPAPALATKLRPTLLADDLPQPLAQLLVLVLRRPVPLARARGCGASVLGGGRDVRLHGSRLRLPRGRRGSAPGRRGRRRLRRRAHERGGRPSGEV